MNDDKIREVFLGNGFVIKEGQEDLKPYVYQAAKALLAAQLEELVKPDNEAALQYAWPVIHRQGINRGWEGVAAAAWGYRGRLAKTWRRMDTAPRDGTLVRLLVGFEENATEDSAEPCPTIGANYGDNCEDQRWHVAGWNWEQDCFTQGHGTPLGWLPMIGD